MEGTWARLKDKIAVETVDAEKGIDVVVTAAALASLHYVEKCKLAYDPETPKAVLDALLYDLDQSAVRAVMQREAVLAGALRNPFKVPAPAVEKKP